MTRAQTPAQMFIYALTLVVVAVVLLFGYRAIGSFSEKADTVEQIQFEKDMESSFRKVANQYGRLEVRDFRLSSDYKEACFLDNYAFDPTISMSAVLVDYPLIYDSLDGAGNPTSNVFLYYHDQELASQHEIGSVELAGNFRCFQVNRSILRISLEGKGDHVVLS